MRAYIAHLGIDQFFFHIPIRNIKLHVGKKKQEKFRTQRSIMYTP